MLQLGICTLDDLKTALTGGQLPSRSCFIGLYPQVMNSESEAAWTMSEAILRSFAIHDGIFKRTSSNRTVHFDREALEALRPTLLRESRHVVHDMGVSDARNSCDFYNAFVASIGREPEFFATDVCFEVFAIRRRHARTTVVVDQQGHVLQIVFPPFVLPAKNGWRAFIHFPLNALLGFVLLKTSVSRTLDSYRKSEASIIETAISLVCPEAKRLASQTPRFHLEQRSALAKPVRTYTTVRALNLLNRSYFSDVTIAQAVQNTLASLSDRGAFLVGSNGDSGSVVNGAVYLKQQDRFRQILSSGNGSEIENIILAARLH